jgi:hypothetical protein
MLNESFRRLVLRIAGERSREKVVRSDRHGADDDDDDRSRTTSNYWM